MPMLFLETYYKQLPHYIWPCSPIVNNRAIVKHVSFIVAQYVFIMYAALQRDLNSLECETEKNDFKVFYLSSQINYR